MFRFRNVDPSIKYLSIFGKKDLTGMLKDFDFEKDGQRFLCLGATTHTLYRNEEFAHETKVFILYSELILMLKQNSTSPD